jgi:hypothetical protein
MQPSLQIAHPQHYWSKEVYSREQQVTVEHTIATAATGSIIPNVYKSQTEIHVFHLLLLYNPITILTRTGKCTHMGCIKLL